MKFNVYSGEYQTVIERDTERQAAKDAIGLWAALENAPILGHATVVEGGVQGAIWFSTKLLLEQNGIKMTQKIKVLETKKLTSLKWLNLYESTYEKEGRTSTWAFASRNRDENNNPLAVTNAVVTVPILVAPNGERKLALIKEYRVPIQDYEYHFPAGLLEKGEAIEHCVERELKEEAGFNLLKICRVSPMMPSSAGMTDETSIMAFAECTLGDGKQELEQSEDIEVILLTHAEVCEWAKKPLKFAAKTWPVLLMYEQMGSLEMK